MSHDKITKISERNKGKEANEVLVNVSDCRRQIRWMFLKISKSTVKATTGYYVTSVKMTHYTDT